MANFIVFTVDHGEQQTFVDVTNANNHDTALATVLNHRDYCCYGVASADLNVLALNWQNGKNVAAVPEPSGIGLLLLSLAVASGCVLGRHGRCHLAGD